LEWIGIRNPDLYWIRSKTSQLRLRFLNRFIEENILCAFRSPAVTWSTTREVNEGVFFKGTRSEIFLPSDLGKGALVTEMDPNP
jgi:hypothetical protein